MPNIVISELQHTYNFWCAHLLAWGYVEKRSVKDFNLILSILSVTELLFVMLIKTMSLSKMRLSLKDIRSEVSKNQLNAEVSNFRP